MKRKNSKTVKKQPKPVPVESENESDDDYGEDMLDMVEAEDLEYIKSAITSKSYSIFNQVRYSGSTPSKSKKRKLEAESEDLETTYEGTIEKDIPVKNLLPIKTHKGLVRRQIEIKSETSEPEDVEESDEEEFDFVEDKIDVSKPISAKDLLFERHKILEQKKIHIGTLSAGVLENPEEKVTNLRTLLQLIDEQTTEVFYTVRKLAIVSLLEIFKDVLPSYEIKNVVQEGIKLKKDTLKLQKYEEALLLYYKKFLQKLEKISSILIRKKGDTRKFNEEDLNVAQLGVQAMCDLLITHPYFNFGENLAQALVPYLNNPKSDVRNLVKEAFVNVFKQDKKEEITLKIVRSVNSYLKTRTHDVHTEMLEIFLALNLKNVNLDAQYEEDVNKKKLIKQKHKVLQMSKKERKRKKRLHYLEKELLETKAEENRKVKERNLTEITKVVFGVYFKILKSSENNKVLGICLEGLTKFSHCINIEYYLDLVKLLENLLQQDWITAASRLRCIQTVFAILSGQGEVLNIDPVRFYKILYQDLLAIPKNTDFSILLSTLNDALIKRRKKITKKRMEGFVKRLATISLHLTHNEALAMLALVKNSLQFDRHLDVLLDTDSGFGDGKFNTEVEDPEYANAASSALYETVLLARHYHPVVRKYALNVAAAVPTSGDHSLEPQLGKCGAEQLYKDYDIDEMAFNPPVPVPKKGQSKKRGNREFYFADAEFERSCLEIQKEIYKKAFFLI